MAKKRPKISQQITMVFDELLDEYLSEENNNKNNVQAEPKPPTRQLNSAEESELIKKFLQKPCSCGKPCKDSLSFDAINKSRREFSTLSWVEKNAFMLSQLNLITRDPENAHSARQKRERQRQKYDYHINIGRPVCKEVFLFYYGESIDRLKRLQKHKLEVGISSTTHGNVGRSPSHSCSLQEKNAIKLFITNYADAHGMPDPGRDLRHGNGRLRILLPSILNYTSVHRAYELSLQSQGKPCVGYRTFIRCWQESYPHIVFNKPGTDLCMTCEEFKKEINKITSDLNESRDDEKAKLYKKALEHIEQAKKERTYYNACSKLAQEQALSNAK